MIVIREKQTHRERVGSRRAVRRSRQRRCGISRRGFTRPPSRYSSKSRSRQRQTSS